MPPALAGRFSTGPPGKSKTHFLTKIRGTNDESFIRGMGLFIVSKYLVWNVLVFSKEV